MIFVYIFAFVVACVVIDSLLRSIAFRSERRRQKRLREDLTAMSFEEFKKLRKTRSER